MVLLKLSQQLRLFQFVVNKNNGIEGLTLEQVKQIFTGEVTNWEDLQ